MNEGHFIVVEGIDGSGTTTQCSVLAERLTQQGLRTHTTREPSDGPIGNIGMPGSIEGIRYFKIGIFDIDGVLRGKYDV